MVTYIVILMSFQTVSSINYGQTQELRNDSKRNLIDSVLYIVLKSLI